MTLSDIQTGGRPALEKFMEEYENVFHRARSSPAAFREESATIINVVDEFLNLIKEKQITMESELGAQLRAFVLLHHGSLDLKMVDTLKREILTTAEALNSGGKVSPTYSELIDFTMWLPTRRRWLASGSPCFRLTHGLFRSLRLTDLGGDVPQLPFEQFIIELPNQDEICVADQAGHPEPVRLIFVSRLPKGTNAVDDTGQPYAPASIMFRWTTASSSAVYIQDADKKLTETLHNMSGDLQHELSQLTVNVIMYLNDLPKAEKAGEQVGLRLSADVVALPMKKMSGYEVGRTVKLPAQIAHAISLGKASWKLAARFVVRGHWRNQAYGPARGDRKRIWIQPHWKGPEDIPTLVRTFEVDTQ